MNFFLSYFIFIVLPTCLLILAACVKPTRKSRVSKRILPTIYSSFGLHNPKNKQCFRLLCFVEKKKTSTSKCWSVALLPATDKKLSDGDCLTGFTGLAACLGFPLTGDHICCAAKYIAGTPIAQCMVNNCRTMRWEFWVQTRPVKRSGSGRDDKDLPFAINLGQRSAGTIFSQNLGIFLLQVLN